MSFLKWVARLESLIWGVIQHVFEAIPAILALLDTLGFDKWAEKIREARQRGGVEFDNFVEENADKIMDGALFCRSVGNLFEKKAQLLLELHAEGTRLRGPGEEDAFTEDQMEYFLKAFLGCDAELANVKVEGKTLHTELAVAAAVEIRRDVSRTLEA